MWGAAQCALPEVFLQGTGHAQPGPFTCSTGRWSAGSRRWARRLHVQQAASTSFSCVKGAKVSCMS
eukprot:5872815-Amphidinium_carterae.1